MKFTDTFINSFNDGFMKCLIGTTPNTYDIYLITLVRDSRNKVIEIKDIKPNYIIEIDDIQHNFDLLNDLPLDKHKEISLKIWKYIFDLKVVKPYIEKNNKLTLENRGTQNIQNSIKDSIKKDLNSAKKFKELINKVFIAKHHTHKGKNIFNLHTYGTTITKLGYSKSGDLWENDRKLYSIEDLFEIVDLIINDLETKDFKFISDKNYNLEKYTTKEDFKEYLISICKIHNIKYTDNINQLLELFKNK